MHFSLTILSHLHVMGSRTVPRTNERNFIGFYGLENSHGGDFDSNAPVTRLIRFFLCVCNVSCGGWVFSIQWFWFFEDFQQKKLTRTKQNWTIPFYFVLEMLCLLSDNFLTITWLHPPHGKLTQLSRKHSDQLKSYQLISRWGWLWVSVLVVQKLSTAHHRNKDP